MKQKKSPYKIGCVILAIAIFMNVVLFGVQVFAQKSEDDYIHWVEYQVPYEAMSKALKEDIRAHKNKEERDWVTTLSYLAAKYGGQWNRYKSKDMDAFFKERDAGKTVEEMTENMKYYPYYSEAYEATLGGMVGSFRLAKEQDADGNPIFEEHYGLKAYSPIAYGYSFSHYDDFGNSRSYGYKRPHLGNDLLGNIGTPIVAVEGGTIEAMGWNQYGGWRIGIRSMDKKRYYYYAHLRKDHPFQSGLKEGDTVQPGDVIGYLGMTGYSQKENVNGMTKPHLHFGMQLIFDESQKEGTNQVWIDVYQLMKLLQGHCSVVERNEEKKEYNRKYLFEEVTTEEP